MIIQEKTQIFSFGANSISSTTTTRYLFPTYNDALAPTTAIELILPFSGKIRKLKVIHNSPAGNGNLITYRVLINGVPTALQVTMASTDSQGENNTDIISFSEGQKITIEVTKPLSIGSSPVDIITSMEIF